MPEFDGFDFDASWLRDIVKLAPASTISVEKSGHIRSDRYWTLEPREELLLSSDGEYEEAFRSVFLDAVQINMSCVGPPALMLSGGLDSASIAGAALNGEGSTLSRLLKTYSVISNEPAGCRESQNILAVTNGHEQGATLMSIPSLSGPISGDDLRNTAFENAHPVSNSILLPGVLYLAASRSGHRIMCDGVDGDLATFVPVRYAESLIRSYQWSDIWRECRDASVNNTYLKGLSPVSILLKSGWEALPTPHLKRLKQTALDFARGRDPFISSMLNGDFIRRNDLVEKRRSFLDSKSDWQSLSDQERHISVITHDGLARGMEGFDRVAARHGIEARHPWADKRLIEFYTRLPFRQKVREGWTKSLVRRATNRWLPPSVSWNTDKSHILVGR